MIGALVLLLLATDGGVPPVTKRNWEHHPSVEAARAVFTEVSAAVKAKTLTLEDHAECEHETFTLGFDAQKRVRYLAIDRGGEDSVQRHEVFYDQQGVARFIFVKGGAVPSAWNEYRWWLDARSKEVWSQMKRGGEGPGGYPSTLDEALIADPRAWARDHASCAKK